MIDYFKFEPYRHINPDTILDIFSNKSGKNDFNLLEKIWERTKTEEFILFSPSAKFGDIDKQNKILTRMMYDLKEKKIKKYILDGNFKNIVSKANLVKEINETSYLIFRPDHISSDNFKKLFSIYMTHPDFSSPDIDVMNILGMFADTGCDSKRIEYFYLLKDGTTSRINQNLTLQNLKDFYQEMKQTDWIYKVEGIRLPGWGFLNHMFFDSMRILTNEKSSLTTEGFSLRK